MKTSIKGYGISVDAANQKIFPSNPKRIALIFSSDIANDYFVSFNEVNSSGEGLSMLLQLPPFEFNVAKHGDGIKGEVWAIATALTTVRVIEISAQ